jgi:hypothetical protein
MKYFKMLLILFLSIFIISFITIESNFVSADDDFEEKYENHGEDDDSEEVYEEIGKTAGWGTIIAIGAAGILFPLRKSAKWIIKNYPESKNIFIFIFKFFRKYHLFIGTIALALSLFHGVTMYLSEGELKIEGIIGLGALLLLMIAGIFGMILYKYKKVRSLRNTHTILIAFALLIGFVHIIIS